MCVFVLTQGLWYSLSLKFLENASPDRETISYLMYYYGAKSNVAPSSAKFLHQFMKIIWIQKGTASLNLC